ncbi:MAG TPA: type II secretion system F family protein [Actinomycetota bacterium]|nr:type II secretion system F family protein [Actinomycetota bacterium]
MIEAIGVAGLVVLSTMLLARVMVAERSRRLLGGLVPDRESAVPTFRVPRNVLVSMGVVAAWSVGARVAGVVGSLAATAIALTAPAMVARRRKRHREIATQERLAEAVSLVASAMRSGRSLHQAIELAATDLDPLLGSTFRRLADRTGLGDPMDESIDAWARDVGGPDARLVAGVLKLHRRTGGSLAASLENLAGTLRDRRASARELASLTAQARLSATILGLLPIGFFLFLSVIARRDLEAAYETPTGVAAIGFGFALQGAAYVWIRHLLRVEP